MYTLRHIIQQRVFSVEECNKIINCKSTLSTKADNSPVNLIDDIEENKWIRKRLTTILFLNNDYTGGDLRIFCGEEVIIKNNIGVLVTLPSWYFHQADKVSSGVRKVLVTWLMGSKFEFFE